MPQVELLSKDPRATAYHEAGHFVATILHGGSVEYVTIVPSKNSRGEVMNGHVAVRLRKDVSDSNGKKDEVRAALITAWAGAVCENKFTGKTVNSAAVSGDLENLWAIVSTFLPDVDDHSRLNICVEIGEATKVIMTSSRVWPAVVALAEALLHKCRFTESEARSIVSPILDR